MMAIPHHFLNHGVFVAASDTGGADCSTVGVLGRGEAGAGVAATLGTQFGTVPHPMPVR